MSEELTIAYMLGSKKANERLKVLQDYVRRLERLALSMCIEAGWSQEDFEAALEKIRRG